MEKRTRVFISFLILAFLIFGLYFFTDWFSKVTGYFSGQDEGERIANCLSDNGAEFYTAVSCSECEKQALVFGRAFGIINRIDCGDKGEKCENLRSVPAWYVNGEIYYGTRNLSELEELGECREGL